MKQITLKRILSSDAGTLGILYVEGVQFCRTLELPWRDNIPNISCIPTGKYTVEKGHMFKYEVDHYLISAVPERSGIFIHGGNYAGDTAKGYKTHVQGCILLGQDWDLVGDQFGITNSKPSVTAFEKFLNWENFQLTIL